MDHATSIAVTGAADARLLLDLDGVAVQAVEQRADGHQRVWLVTSDQTAAACPQSGRGLGSPRGCGSLLGSSWSTGRAPR